MLRDRFWYDCVIRASGAWSLSVWRFFHYLHLEIWPTTPDAFFYF